MNVSSKIHRIQRALGLCALLLGCVANSQAFTYALRPCVEAKVSGSWVGVTKNDDIAILLVLETDKSGRLEIWFREKGKPGFLRRRVDGWEVAEDGSLKVLSDKGSSIDPRSVNLVKAKAQCSELSWSVIQAEFWIEGVAYAELSLSPLAEFRAKNRHLEMFFESLGEAR
jgi:hypothetical protein